MSKARKTAVRDTARLSEWVDIVRPDRIRIDFVRRRLALPVKLTPLSLCRFLYPSIVPVPPVSFLATFFTAPSVRDVFDLHPLQLWFADHAIVTITLQRSLRSVVTEQRRSGVIQADFLGRVLAAVIGSHEGVVQGLNDAFFGPAAAANPRDWHRKERRLAFFVRLLEHQIRFVRNVDREVARVGRLHDQLRGLCEIARHASYKVRQLGACPFCSQASRRARR